MRSLFKSTVFILAVAMAFPVFLGSSTRYNRTIVVTAGTPIRLTAATRTLAREISIQMAVGGTGPGYVMAGISNGRTPSASNSIDLTAQLAAATASAPGSQYSDTNEKGIDISQIWVDGSTNGDPITISWDQL